jgi:hypothetical protein
MGSHRDPLLSPVGPLPPRDATLAPTLRLDRCGLRGEGNENPFTPGESPLHKPLGLTDSNRQPGSARLTIDDGHVGLPFGSLFASQGDSTLTAHNVQTISGEEGGNTETDCRRTVPPAPRPSAPDGPAARSAAVARAVRRVRVWGRRGWGSGTAAVPSAVGCPRRPRAPAAAHRP